MEHKHWRTSREDCADYDCEEPIHRRKRGESSFLASESRHDEAIMGGSPRTEWTEYPREDCEESIHHWKRGKSSYLDSFADASGSKSRKTSHRTGYPSFRRSLLVWILAVATALYTILLAFGPNYFSEAPHLIGDLPRQTSATQTIIEESGISLDFEDVVSGGSSSLQDKPPPVDSSLVKVHYLPEPAEEIPTHIKKQKAQQHEESETGVEPATEPVSIASFSELSVFGNSTSPSDFQRYTPNAPSCTEPLDTADVSYTLVSQVSWDRLWMVGYHCERWGDNPISMAVLSDRSSDHIKARLIREGCYEPGLTVQVVSKSKYDPTGKEYPVNILRNMAISAVKTSHIVYVDIDFWPSADLHKILSNNETKERLAKDAKLATIIPAFQMFWRCKEDCHEENIAVMPEDKDSLINLMMKRRASTFDQTNIGGHGSTKYSTWWDQSPATFVDLPCINSNRYEPYLTFRYCSELPPFQEVSNRSILFSK